jgi:ectoine hydroxylase-related dioxygenase (phytanoyl-CoA dioxygenase family)
MDLGRDLARTDVVDFERDGYVFVEAPLDRRTVARLTEAVDRVWAEERPDGRALHLLGFVGRDPAFIDLVHHPKTFPLVHGVLGWNIYVYHCHLDVHPPLHEPPRWRWHQDGGRQNVELESPRPRLSVKVAYFLTDVEAPTQGALRVIPGSHRRETLAKDCEPDESTPLMVGAGSAVVFDRRLWHARGDNVSERTRKALFYGYTYRWIRPRDDLGLGAQDLAGLDPVRRQLLGAGTSAIGYWIPTEEDVPLRAIG